MMPDRRQGRRRTARTGPKPGFNNTDANGNPIDPIVNEVVELRLGVRLPLPHPQPRRDGHDAAGDGPRRPRRCPTHPCSRSPGAASSSTGPTARRSTTPTRPPGADPKNEIGFRIERAEVTGGVAGAVRRRSPPALANTTTYTDMPADPTIDLRLPGHRLQRRRRLALQRRPGRGAARGPDRADRGRAAGAHPARRVRRSRSTGPTTPPTPPASSSSAPSAPERSACSPRWLRPTPRYARHDGRARARTATG